MVLLLRLIRRNLVPLAKLQQATRRISLGQFQTRVTITSGDEFEELASSFNSMAEQN
jgi:nitrate/nitrite-specific signal transduction histidine kinase